MMPFAWNNTISPPNPSGLPQNMSGAEGGEISADESDVTQREQRYRHESPEDTEEEAEEEELVLMRGPGNGQFRTYYAEDFTAEWTRRQEIERIMTMPDEESQEEEKQHLWENEGEKKKQKQETTVENKWEIEKKARICPEMKT